MDALTLKTVINEIKEQVVGKRVEKIYQPKPFELILKVNKQSLYISIHPTLFRMSLTDQKGENPISPPMFTMILRKYVGGGYIKDITMDGLERIVKIHIENKDELMQRACFTLIVELMGKHSNAVLIKEDHVIIDCIKRIPITISSVRQLLPNLVYKDPPKKGDIADLGTINRQNIHSFTGISPFIKKQIMDGTIQMKDVKDSIENPRPVIVYEQDKPKHMATLDIPGFQCKPFKDMSSMIEYFYSIKGDSVQSTDLVKTLNTLLERDKRSVNIHNNALEKDEDKYKLYGELITAYCHSIESGSRRAALLNYYTNETVDIALDPLITPMQNAQKFFKKYNKAKSAKKHAKEQIEILKERIEYLENIIYFLKSAKSSLDVEQIKLELKEMGMIKKSRQKQKPRRLEPIKYTCNGFTILVGRNSMQNDELTTKKAKAHDMWLHTKDIPGSHTIIITDNKEPDNETIKMAAMIAAYHSKAKNSQNVPVDYTFIKYVKKPAHALLGKVIFTHQRTVYVTPDIDIISSLS